MTSVEELVRALHSGDVLGVRAYVEQLEPNQVRVRDGVPVRRSPRPLTMHFLLAYRWRSWWLS